MACRPGGLSAVAAGLGVPERIGDLQLTGAQPLPEEGRFPGASMSLHIDADDQTVAVVTLSFPDTAGPVEDMLLEDPQPAQTPEGSAVVVGSHRTARGPLPAVLEGEADTARLVLSDDLDIDGLLAASDALFGEGDVEDVWQPVATGDATLLFFGALPVHRPGCYAAYAGEGEVRMHVAYWSDADPIEIFEWSMGDLAEPQEIGGHPGAVTASAEIPTQIVMWSPGPALVAAVVGSGTTTETVIEAAEAIQESVTEADGDCARP